MSADANTSKLAFERESTWGQLNGTPALKLARITSETIKHEKETVASAEIRSDRQQPDLAHVGEMAKGGVEFELSYTDWLEMVESALNTTKVSLALSESCNITQSNQRVTAVSGTPFANVIPGASLRIAGASNAGNNGIKQVAAVGGGGAYITLVAGSIAADQSAVTLAITGTQMCNGVTQTSYSFERGILASGGSYVYQRFLGMVIDEFMLKFASKAIITGTMNLIGKAGSEQADPANSYAAASTDSVMTASVNVANFMYNGSAMSEKLKSFNITIKNNSRGKDEIGNASIFEVGTGQCKITGDFSAYFRNNTLFTAFRTHAEVALGWTVTDESGNSIVFYLPRIKFSDGNPNIGGGNQDVMQPINFEALIGEGEFTKMLMVSFVPAAA